MSQHFECHHQVQYHLRDIPQHSLCTIPSRRPTFPLPVTPPPAADGIQDGVVSGDGTVCLQTIPSWLTNPPGLNGTTVGSEDCLFLDVIVPEGLLIRASTSISVPVFHWIYGGGFIFGAKDIGPNPAALLDGMSPDKKFIVVASNYRFRAFGVDEL